MSTNPFEGPVYGAKPSKPEPTLGGIKSEEEFLRKRRMFAIIDDQLQIATAGDRRTHIEWFRQQNWVTPSGDGFDQIVRGYYLPNQHVVAYVGSDFTGYRDTANTLMRFISRLQSALDIPDQTPVYVGAKRGETFMGMLVPHKPMGEVQQVVETWQKQCLAAQTPDPLKETHFEIRHHNYEQLPIGAKLVQEASGAISIYFAGYGNKTMENGHGVAMYIEVGDDGHPVIYTFEDYDQEDFTSKLTFAKAKEK